MDAPNPATVDRRFIQVVMGFPVGVPYQGKPGTLKGRLDLAHIEVCVEARAPPKLGGFLLLLSQPP